MVGPTEQCGHLHNVLARILASNGLRDGSDLGLIPDVFEVCRVGGVESVCVEHVECNR